MSLFNMFNNKKPADGDQTGQQPQEAPQDGAHAPEAPAAAPAGNAPEQAPQGAAPAKPDKIRAFDNFGREVLIPREEWRTNFLTKGFEEAGEDPDKLAFLVMKGVEDGFESDVLEHAKHLRDIDTNKERGWTILGIAYMANNDLDNANKVFSDYVDQFGESSSILANLAKVCARRGETTVAAEMLWHAVELDPNQEGAFRWYVSSAREKSVEAAVEAVNRIAALPNSWRARTWQAHQALEEKDPEKALALYEEAFKMTGDPIPADILQQVSGDLGSHGYVPEILRVVAPHYQPAVHGLLVGSNIIRAHFDLGQLDAAKSLVELLFSMKRPDWQAGLSFWDAQIAGARNELARATMQANPKIEILNFEGPIWLRRDVPAAAMGPQKSEQSVIVAITSTSFAAYTNPDGTPRKQANNMASILARSLGLFLIEQIHFKTNAIGRLMQPWVANENGGFALFSAPCDDKTACELGKSGPFPANFVAIPHIVEGEKNWTVSIRVINPTDSTEIGTLTQEIAPNELEAGFLALTDQLIKFTCEKCGVQTIEAPAFYQVPTGPEFGNYQLRLEQALIVTISASSPARSRSLHGERGIVDGMLRMCLVNPQNQTLRMLLARVVNDMNKIHPAVITEFRERLHMFESTQATPEPFQESVRMLLGQAIQG
jgi:tetratricopeptide (TPR) repeat protein